jgi:peptidoglycan hydrolase CwlO-like protein
MKFSLLFLLLSASSVFAQNGNYGYLKADDQKFYKNDIMEGNNKQERIDSLVKEINKMYGEMASMKADIQTLRADVEELKKKK